MLQRSLRSGQDFYLSKLVAPRNKVNSELVMEVGVVETVTEGTH